MKATSAVLTAGVLVAGMVATPAQETGSDRQPLSITQRGQMIFDALKAQPLDTAAVARALQDIGHVEATFRSQPLTRWVDGARIVDGRIHLTKVVALNRASRGPAPGDWIEQPAATVKAGHDPTVLRLAMAPADDVRARRDEILAQADAEIRAGLAKLADDFPQLKKTNWGSVTQALAGKSPPGRISIWVAHYSGGRTGARTAVAKEARYNVMVLLRPLHWPVPAGEWRMQQLHGELALMGQVFADAGDPDLRSAVKKLIADALAPLERLNDQAASGRLTTRPAESQPAGDASGPRTISAPPAAS
jgi:hypothetical protein